MWWTLTALAGAPIAARDGDRIDRGGPIAFALLSGVPSDDALQDLRASDLAFVALSDAVPRGTRKEYDALQARLAGLPIEPIPGAGEARGDRRLKRFVAAWDGLGVRGFGPAVPWRAFDLAAGGGPWRVVVLTADRDGLGESTWHDELFWVPKVLADVDGPVLVLLDQPVGTLGGQPSDAAGSLAELVHRHTDPSAVPLFAAAATPSPELVLPGGIWGEAWLGFGRIDVPATLPRQDGEHALEPGFDRALASWFVPTGDAALAQGAPYAAERYPVVGWWRLTVDRDQLTVTLRMRRPDGWADAYSLAWSADTGWRTP